MATTTEYLGLHQWEPSDQFLRTDFNTDFAKIDAGVKEARGAADRTMEAMVPLRYNVFQTALQSYYEGKGGTQKALLLDGFMDMKQIKSVTGGGWDKAGMCLSMTAAHDLGNLGNSGTAFEAYGTSGVLGYMRLDITRCGFLNSVTLISGCTYNSSNQTGGGSVKVSLVEWDSENNWPASKVLVGPATYQLSPPTSRNVRMTFPMNYPVTVGSYGLKVERTLDSTVNLSIGGTSNPDQSDPKLFNAYKVPIKDLMMGYSLSCSTSSDASATLHTIPVSAGVNFLRADAYIHHSGTVTAMGLRDSRQVLHSLARKESSPAVTVKGESCTETRFSLNAPQAVSFPISAELTYTSGKIFDYGILFY